MEDRQRKEEAFVRLSDVLRLMLTSPEPEVTS